VGKLAGPLLGARDPHPAEHLQRLLERLPLGDVLMGPNGLHDLLPDPVVGVQRGHGVLEDHADLAPPDVLHLLRRQLQEVPALEPDLSLHPGHFLVDQAQHGEKGHALPRAGLPHNPQRLAAIDLERDPVDGFHQAVVGGEVDLEVLDLQEGFGHYVYLTRGSRNA
jgi:hypothetical protein